MEFLQTYETTISDDTGRRSITVFVIPARSLGREQLDINQADGLQNIAHELFGAEVLEPQTDLQLWAVYQILTAGEPEDPGWSNMERHRFASYVTNARIIPFEASPLGAESLASIATAAVKAGTISIGTTVGFLAAQGIPSLLLITVPLGIVLCGVSVSFAKWLEENRKPIWNRLLARFEQESKKKEAPYSTRVSQSIREIG